MQDVRSSVPFDLIPGAATAGERLAADWSAAPLALAFRDEVQEWWMWDVRSRDQGEG